jgi:trehalose 6-phosphate phosphatase
MAIDDDWRLPAPPSALLRDAALFLDFDGTIVALAARPDAIHVDESLRQLMRTLHQHLKGRVAVISGRPVAEIRHYLQNHDVIVAGSHGLELSWPDGSLWALSPPAELARLSAELEDMPKQYPGILIEKKPFGVAIHYREAPDAKEVCRQRAIDLSQRTGLRLQPGKMVFELKAPGADKGTAIDKLMSSPPMLGYTPVFLGDDDTDEAGFSTVARLGGSGILVGPLRRTAALYSLSDVEDAITWLKTMEAQR